jgi:adenylate kinase family enzyme
MKIWIGGGVAHGKSTFAKKLAKETGWALLDLDSIIFKDNCGNRHLESETEMKLREFIKNNQNWIIEGAQKRTFCFQGISKADIIIIIKLNKFMALGRFFFKTA